MDRAECERPILRSRVGTILAAALAATLLAGCGTASAPGRPHPNRPESSKATTPGTPRGAGTPAAGRRTGLPRSGGVGRGGKATGRTTPPSRTAKAGATAGRARRTTAAAGLAGTASGLFNWGLGRPPGGPGAGFGSGPTSAGRTGVSRPKPGLSPKGPTSTDARGSTPGRPSAPRATAGMQHGPRASASPYMDPAARALADGLGGAHRRHAGVYRPPAGHRVGQPLATAGDLAGLPSWASLVHLNGYLVSYSRLTPWVANMGVHWGHRGPGLVLMQNRDHQVTATETAFPAGAGWHPWYDQPQGRPAGPIYSEHLYFVAPTAITPTMSPTLTSDVASWQAFGRVNGAKMAQYRVVGPDPTGRATQYGPSSSGIRVLVDGQGHVVGLVGAWPSSSPQGWRPWFDQPQGRPIQDPVLGSVYTQHLWLVDPRSLPALSTRTGAPAPTGATKAAGASAPTGSAASADRTRAKATASSTKAAGTAARR